MQLELHLVSRMVVYPRLTLGPTCIICSSSMRILTCREAILLKLAAQASATSAGQRKIVDVAAAAAAREAAATGGPVKTVLLQEEAAIEKVPAVRGVWNLDVCLIW